MFSCLLSIKCWQVWQRYSNSCEGEACGVSEWRSPTCRALRHAPACQNSTSNSNLKSFPPANSWAPAPPSQTCTPTHLSSSQCAAWACVSIECSPPSVRLSKRATPEYHIIRLRSSAFLSTSKGFSCLCAATAFRVQRLGPPPTSSTLWLEGVTLTSHWLILAWGKAQR